ARRHSWQRMNPARLNRIEGSEGIAIVQDSGTEGEIAGCGIAGGQARIRWRFDPRGNLRRRENRRPAGPAHVRVVGKDPVNLDYDLADVRYCGAAGEQTGEGGAGDRGRSSSHKIVSRLDLEFAANGRTRCGCN